MLISFCVNDLTTESDLLPEQKHFVEKSAARRLSHVLPFQRYTSLKGCVHDCVLVTNCLFFPIMSQSICNLVMLCIY